MRVNNFETAEIIGGGLEPEYLLRLFFEYPPQGFAVEYKQLAAAPRKTAVTAKKGREKTEKTAQVDELSVVSMAEKTGETRENLLFGNSAAEGMGAVQQEAESALCKPSFAAGTAAVAVADSTATKVPVQQNAPSALRRKLSFAADNGAAGMMGGIVNSKAAVQDETAERPAEKNAPFDSGALERAVKSEAAAAMQSKETVLQAAAETGAETVPQTSPSFNLPLFSCRFGLLTAVDEALLKKLQKLPFYRMMAKLFSARALFCGTTVSEFAPLPLQISSAQAEQAVGYLRKQAKNYPFVIVKDLPQTENVLISNEAANAAQNFANALEHSGFISVEGQAIAYVPIDFADIDAYLARFSKARRKDFRRKLRAKNNLKIEILLKGNSAFYDEEQIELYHRLYAQVYKQSTQHFDFLTKDFFRALLQQADDSLRFITYRDQNGRLIGYNICFVLGNKLADKYIGLDYPAATEHSLYFVSWFYNLAYAKSQGLEYYIAGWTDSQVKAALGAKFVMTRHAVYIRNPLLRKILQPLRFLFEGEARAGAKQPPTAKVKTADYQPPAVKNPVAADTLFETENAC